MDPLSLYRRSATRPASGWGSAGTFVRPEQAPPNPTEVFLIDPLVQPTPIPGLQPCFPGTMLPGPVVIPPARPAYATGTMPARSTNCGCNSRPYIARADDFYAPAGQAAAGQAVPLWQYGLAAAAGFGAGYFALRTFAKKRKS